MLTPSSTLFPYTTLFRSPVMGPAPVPQPPPSILGLAPPPQQPQMVPQMDPMTGQPMMQTVNVPVFEEWYWHIHRSEEHTSELQSRQYLVCRLPLEKKKLV